MTRRGEDCWVIDISLHYPLHSLLMLMISNVRILARLPRVRRLEILATHGHTPDRTWTLCGNSEVNCGLTRYLLYIMCISRNKSHKISIDHGCLTHGLDEWLISVQLLVCRTGTRWCRLSQMEMTRINLSSAHSHSRSSWYQGSQQDTAGTHGHTTKLTYFV